MTKVKLTGTQLNKLMSSVVEKEKSKVISYSDNSSFKSSVKLTESQLTEMVDNVISKVKTKSSCCKGSNDAVIYEGDDLSDGEFLDSQVKLIKEQETAQGTSIFDWGDIGMEALKEWILGFVLEVFGVDANTVLGRTLVKFIVILENKVGSWSLVWRVLTNLENQGYCRLVSIVMTRSFVETAIGYTMDTNKGDSWLKMLGDVAINILSKRLSGNISELETVSKLQQASCDLIAAAAAEVNPLAELGKKLNPFSDD